jgi:hypothetical protein
MPTDAEYARAAETAAKKTTITYADWKRKVDQGKYSDVTTTEWYKLFDALGHIPVGVVPVPPVVEPPVGQGSALHVRPLPPTLSGRKITWSPASMPAIQSGDEVYVGGGNYPFLRFTEFFNVKLRIDPAASLAGVYVAKLNRCDIDGGFAKSTHLGAWDSADGWKIDDCQGTWIHRLRAENCGGQGVIVGGHATPTRGLYLTDVITRNCGGMPSASDYASKGAHGAYIGSSSGGVFDSVFGNFDCDNPNGHGIQIGGVIDNCIFTGFRVKARRSDRGSEAGSGIRVWGSGTKNIKIVNGYGDGCAYKAISSGPVGTSPMAVAHHVASLNSHGFEEMYGSEKGVEVIEAQAWTITALSELKGKADTAYELPWDIDGMPRVNRTLGPKD